MSIIAFFPVKLLFFYNELWLNGCIYHKCTCLCWLKVQQYRQGVLIISTGSCEWYIIQTSSTQLWRYRVYKSSGGGEGLWLLDGYWSESTLVPTGRIFIPVPVWMVSSHWSNIDPECRVLTRCYLMRMKPSWVLSLDSTVLLPKQHKFTHKYGECFYWVVQQLGFALKICIACLHVGQMIFAGNKYLLLKRITVWLWSQT